MKKIIPFTLACLLSFIELKAQTIVPIWPQDIPNFQPSDELEITEETDITRISKVQKPTLEIYLPSKKNRTGQGVLVCPGGGYQRLAYDWEGTDIAKWLNSKGIAAFVLKYRLPQSKSVTITHETPFLDAQRAIRFIRYHAKEYDIDSNKIGVMGFSAGGHLASTLGTHFGQENTFAKDEIDQIDDRPDFMALIYPVISMGPVTHAGSKENLLGDNPSDELVDNYSNELQVKEKTPPTFLIHSADDRVVPVKNSLLMYEALIQNEVLVEMHLYPTGGHGFSLAIGKGHLSDWPDLFIEWIKSL